MLSPPIFSPEFITIFKKATTLANPSYTTAGDANESDHGDVEYANRMLQLGAAFIEPQQRPDGSGAYVILPADMTLHSIVDARYLPDHVKQSVQAFDPASLADYVKVFKDNDGTSAIFADLPNRTLRAVLNYHTPGKPNRSDHNVVLTVALDPIYAAWNKLDGVLVDQVEFARFLEEHAGEITTPDPAQIVEIARSLEVSTNIEFKKAVNLQSGLVQLNFVEQDNARTPGNFEIPKAITITTPVYFGGLAQEVKFFFRYVAKNGTLRFKLDQYRRSHIERDAFLDITKAVATAAGVPYYLGRLTS